MTQILIPIVFAVLVFLFFGTVLYLTKYKKKDKNSQQGCCSGSSSCCEAPQEGDNCACNPPGINEQ